MSGGAKPPAMTFELLRNTIGDSAARLGRLALSGRPAIETPNFFGTTSRGVIPHLTPDNVTKHSHIGGAYVALEDFFEMARPNTGRKSPSLNGTTPPILQTPPSSQYRPLHAFTAMPSTVVTVLGARRFPPVAPPSGNTQNSITICTSHGFQQLRVDEYHAAVETLKPDIAIPLADLTYSKEPPKSKRAIRMTERTDEWLKAWFNDLDGEQAPETSKVATFAPVLPVDYGLQWEYLDTIAQERIQNVSGLALYDVDVIPDLQALPTLTSLPRLSLDQTESPHQILRQVSLGVDVFLLPFLNQVSDSGIALAFTFPPRAVQNGISDGSSRILPLGMDMSSENHQLSVTPLYEGCACYTCTRHHRAYVRHLLHAREMLGWTLLQIHNHAILSAFFDGIRSILAEEDGLVKFEEARARFTSTYEPVLPRGTGERPRARGYHFKSEGGDAKMNKPAWGKFGPGEETGGGTGFGSSADISENGNPAISGIRDMTGTPVVPDEEAHDLGVIDTQAMEVDSTK